MYPLLLGMPLSDSRELTDRPETDDTEEAVDTERSRAGMALRAIEGATQGSGDPARSGGGELTPVLAMAIRCCSGQGRKRRMSTRRISMAL
jgi:hypothetical protein